MRPATVYVREPDPGETPLSAAERRLVRQRRIPAVGHEREGDPVPSLSMIPFTWRRRAQPEEEKQ